MSLVESLQLNYRCQETQGWLLCSNKKKEGLPEV